MNNKKTDKIIPKADTFTHEIYRVTKQFPKEELYGITSQIRRSAISIPLNLIEGFARQTRKEHRRFLEIAYGSLKETKYLLYFSFRETFISDKNYKKLLNMAEELGKMIWTKTQTLKKIMNNEQ